MTGPEKYNEGKNLVEELESFVNWLIDNKLQNKFGTWRTFSRIKESESFIVPFPAIVESEPSAILTLILPAQGEYVEKM